MLTRRRRGNSTSDNDPLIYVQPSTQPVRKQKNETKAHVNGSLANGNYSQPSLNRGSGFLTELSSNGRDRTHEFVSVIKSAQARKNIIPTLNQRPSIGQRSEFAIISKKIGMDTATTFEKLQKLTLLVGKEASHGNSANDILQLTNFIRLDLTNLNKQIAQLQQLLKTQRVQQNGRHKLFHSNSVIVALQSKLATISTEFKMVLEARNENLRQEKVQQASQYLNSFPLETSPERRQLSSVDLVIDMDDNNASERRFRQRQQQTTRQKIVVDDRADTMTEIEQTIVELGGIFQQLAQMVKEQEEIVQRIDTHVEETQLNIDIAHTEIVKYFHSVSSSRNLMIKIFIVLIVLFIVLTWILT